MSRINVRSTARVKLGGSGVGAGEMFQGLEARQMMSGGHGADDGPDDSRPSTPPPGTTPPVLVVDDRGPSGGHGADDSRPSTGSRSVVDSIASFDDRGSVVYELGDDHGWHSTRLEDKAREDRGRGGRGLDDDEMELEEVTSYTDPKDGKTYSAGLTAKGLVLARNDGAGQWTFRNLTQETGGEVISPVISDLDVMIAPDGTVSLVGVNSSRQLVRYFQTGAKNAAGEYVWTSRNITVGDLLATGQAAPAWRDDLVAYATPWGALNVVGLDDSGNIQAVWWAPGMEHWATTDLTTAYGAQKLLGGLTVYQTPWGGVNIAGVDDHGGLRAAWWVPGFAGEWRHSDLSDEIGGPRLNATSVTSFVSSWGGINIVGRDDSSGEVKAYWWSPERTREGWSVTSLAASVGGAAPVLTGGMEGRASGDGSLNVFAKGSAGGLHRLYWYPGFGGEWKTEDLSVSSTPS